MESQCRGCGSSKLEDAFSLGTMPPVNLFIQSPTDSYQTFPLDVVFCNACTLVQLKSAADPKQLFSVYQHLSSASQTNANHLKEVSSVMEYSLIPENLPVLEIGSNDGSLLKETRNWSKNIGIKTVSIDPAENLSDLAKSNSDFHYCGFFDELTARTIRSEHGPFQLVVAINVLAHTPNLHSFLKGVYSVLDQNGTFLFECTDVVPTLLSGQFDTVYHEHYSYFSAHSVHKALDQANLKIVKIDRIPTQGGSLRIIAKKNTSKQAEKIESSEHSLEEFKKIAEKIENFKSELTKKLTSYKSAGKTVIGLGAPARGMVLLHSLKLNSSNISWIIDDTPHKQNRYIPGTGIKIQNWDSLNDTNSSGFVFLVLSWNYKYEIISKLKQSGVKNATLLIPFPKIEELKL
jgi:SAM-dependent methyltransferase